jgi:hypothetical protein
VTYFNKPTLEPVLESPFEAVISFGDSFSDNGFLSGHGFKRYTNTWTWAEYLSQLLGLPHESWAHGGAMTDDRNQAHPAGVRWSGLSWQIERFLAGLDRQDDISRILFTVMCGSNDYWGGQRSPAISAANIRTALESLSRVGARHIIYRETSAVIMAPGYLSGEWAPDYEGWKKLVEGTNALTRKLIGVGFAFSHPEVRLYYLLSDPLFTKIKNREAGFAFENLDKKWLGIHEHPEPYRYMWWDDWHPMGQVHLLAALETASAIKEALDLQG